LTIAMEIGNNVFVRVSTRARAAFVLGVRQGMMRGTLAAEQHRGRGEMG